MIDLTRRGLAASALALGLSRSASAQDCPVATPPMVHRLQLGAFTVTTLLDADAMIDGPWPIVGEDRERGAVEALMRENRLPPNRFKPGFTPTVVQTGRETILFDTGNGEVGFVPRPTGGRMAGLLNQAGIAPDTIDVVVLTHCHTDHIGGLMENGRPLFPHARYVVGADEDRFWRDDARLSAAPESNAYKSARVFRSHLLPLAGRTTFVKSGDTVAPGITALAAFGHTPGHLAYHVESAGQRLLVWGDCAHHEVASLVHPEWHAFFDMDKAGGAATRRTIYDMAATDGVLVAAYHTTFPSLGYVVRQGAGYRWIPLTYQFDR